MAYQDLRETWASLTVLRRKVCASVKGLAVGCEKYGERPATLSADGGYSRLVAGVDVGSFVAIDFDGDELAC